MNVPAKLGAFGLAVAVTFGVGYVLGAAVGPEPDPAPAVTTLPAGGGHRDSHGLMGRLP